MRTFPRALVRFACLAVCGMAAGFGCGPSTTPGGALGVSDARESVRESADEDGDGVADAEDECPHEPEDPDGFEDADGCPDRDNDQDGVPDVEDQCPGLASHRSRPRPGTEDLPLGCPGGEPEYSDGPPGDMDDDGYADAVDRCPHHAETFPSRLDGGCTDDGDGCPDGTAILLVDCGILILDVVSFTSRSAEPSDAAPLFDALAQLFTAHAELRVEVVGHVEGREPAALGQERAEAVRDALLARGVEAERLSLRNAGATEPRASTRGLRGAERADARDRNRRVSFAVLAAPRLPGRPR